MLGLTTVAYALLQMHPWHHYQFLMLLVIGVVASRLKVKLPGIEGNMSVNLPFILIAFVQLSLAEALLITCASTVAQCFPKHSGKPKPVQVFFNVNTMALATGVGWLALTFGAQLRSLSAAPAAAVALAALVFFLANTLPVATVISLSERQRMLKVWSSIAHLSFPHYVASAGITSMVTAASRHVGWQIPLLVLPVMYAIYRCYQIYFGRMSLMPRALALVNADSHSIQSELSSSRKV